MTELFDALYNRRSIRKFTNQDVQTDQVKEIIRAGMWAPSGLNNQPWRFLVLRSDDPRKPGLEEHTKYHQIIHDSNILIVVLLEKDAMYNPMKDYQGAGACIQNMLLAIHGLGLGGVWLGEIVNQSEAVLPLLGLSGERYELMAVLALGYPEQEGRSSRKEMQEMLVEEI
ncbi:MAG: nitroreductase family protein [Desulfovibrionales bacterium]